MGQLSSKEQTKLWDTLQESIASLIKTKAASLQYNDPAAAINILEKAVEILNRKDLDELLGEMLVQQSIKAINDACEPPQPGQAKDKQSIVNKIENAVADMERASKLGCKNADKNLEGARNILKQAKEGLFSMSTFVSKIVDEAKNAADKHDYNRAVNIMENAYKNANADDKTPIKNKLAQFLNIRAVENANIANRAAEEALKANNTMVADKLRRLLDNPFKIHLWILNLLRLLFTGFGKPGLILIPIAAYICTAGFVTDLFQLTGTGLDTVLYITIGIAFLIIISTTNSRRSRRYICEVKCCTSVAAYEFSLQGYGKHHLCKRHSNRMMALTKMPLKIDSNTKGFLSSAEADLKRALSLDPGNSQVKENLKGVTDLIAAINAR